jgi:hypothetical protein
MRPIPQILLKRYKNQFNEDDQEQAEHDFKAAWRSARPVLDALETELEMHLNKLIIEDEQPNITELPNPTVKWEYLKGSRATTRYVLNKLLRNKDLHTGESNE